MKVIPKLEEINEQTRNGENMEDGRYGENMEDGKNGENMEDGRNGENMEDGGDEKNNETRDFQSPFTLRNGGMSLKRKLGLFDAIAITVGSTIGSGIFVAPAGVVAITGSVGLALIIWTVCGICTAMGAMCFAELGTMFPDSGGTYSYIEMTFGPLPAFLNAWVWIPIRANGGTAIVSLTFASYLVQSITGICDNNVLKLPVIIIALLLITLHTVINCIGVRCVGHVQKMFVIGKVMALVVIIFVGIIHLAQGYTQHYQHPFSGTNWAPELIASACFQCLFSYNGWEQICNVVEEVKNNNRDTPVAIATSMTLVTLVYVLANVAYFAVLTPQEMVASDAVALTFGERKLGVMAWVMAAFVMLSTFGTTNGNMLSRSRLVYVVARNGQLPQCLSLLHNKRATPIPAIILTCVMVSALVTTSGIRTLMQHVAYVNTLTTFTCVCALLWLRYTQPNRPRPYKVHLAIPVLYLMVHLLLLILPIIYQPMSVGVSLVLIMSGIPIYYLFIHRQDITTKCSPIMNKLTYCCQCLCLCVPGQKDD